MKEHLVT